MTSGTSTKSATARHGSARRILCATALTLGAIAALAAVIEPTYAQQQVAQTAPKKSAPPAKAAPSEPAQKAAEPAGRSRLDMLEQQLVDMQVAIGTLESLSRGGGQATGNAAAPARGVAAGIEQGRVDALETQVRALAAQVDQLSQQIRQMQPGRAAAAPQPSPLAQATAPAASTPDNDPIGRIIGGTRAPAPQSANAAIIGTPQPSAPSAAAPLIASDASSKQVYETAYGYLLAQDYASAEASFDEFLKRFPNDALAGNAQYWLGETYFVRGQYKPAAAAFLKGYQTYAKNAKAPDALLKLAMSLDRLGQKDAACASFGELTIQVPHGPRPHQEPRRQRAPPSRLRLSVTG